jgi:hypothetical protein
MCRFQDRLAAYATGERDAELEGHLPSCASCRGELEEIGRLLHGVVESSRAPREDEPFWTDFTRAVRVVVDERSSRKRRRWGFLLALTPIVAAATAIVMFVALRHPVSLRTEVPAARTIVAQTQAPEKLDLSHTITDVDDLDEEQLGTVLAALDESDEASADEDEDGPPQSPSELIEDLGPHELSRVEHAL